MTMRGFLLGALVLVVAAAASSCGAGAVGDCSGGAFDGHGGCIPNSHAPRRVEAAATRHFHGQQVDRVGCYVQRQFHHRGSLIKVWGCWRVAGGILTHDLACVPASHGRPLTPPERATIPARRLRCSD